MGYKGQLRKIKWRPTLQAKLWRGQRNSNSRLPGLKLGTLFPDLPQNHADYCTTLSDIIFCFGFVLPSIGWIRYFLSDTTNGFTFVRLRL